VAEDKTDVPFEAEWTENLRHRPDPNRVSSLQTPSPGRFEKRPPAAAALPTDTGTLHIAREDIPSAGAPGEGEGGGRTAESRSHLRTTPPPPLPSPGVPGEGERLAGYAPTTLPTSTTTEPSYYDIPILQQPVWKWEIACYFYLGGLSAGAYLLGRAADRAGGKAHRKLSRIASYIALGALIPCPPLLIADLGDPKRFHHMLRVWKPSTPMNLGTWSIVAYSGMAGYEVVRQYLREHERALSPRRRANLLKLMNNGVLLALHDAAGIPFSLMVAGYTGVLLSCTSNPLWCKNPWLGPLFSASAIATGAEAVSLALDLTDKSDGAGCQSQQVLQHIDTVAHAAELACTEGFRRFAGEKGSPLRRGAMRKHHLISIGGILAAETLKRLPVEDALRKPVRMVAAALGLMAGFSLRWSMIYAGHAAAADPHLSRVVSRPDDSAKRVGGNMPGAGERLARSTSLPQAPTRSRGNGHARR
jgi:formate-dependent nitrite reductase membrane component NrfD